MQVVSISTDRLHTIPGQYTGKDDPVAIVRTQKIFPAPEEVISPYTTGYYVAGDARGSHHMPIMPAAINTAVTGPYCLPLVTGMAYSVTSDGKFSEGVDMFGNPAWDATCYKVQTKADEMRRQGFIGAAMLPTSELEYGSMRKSLADLEEQFTIRQSLTLFIGQKRPDRFGTPPSGCFYGSAQTGPVARITWILFQD